RKILKAYGKQIREESKTRSIELLASLQAYVDENPSQVGSEVLKEIQRRIDDQNYVAAEDLMNRLLSGDLEEEVLQDGEDYLAQFLDEEEYSQNIRKTAAAGTRLSALLGNTGLRNKDTRGGQRILENWITNGMGEEKVRLLLGSLGFRVDTVEKAPPIGGTVDNYLVTLQRPVNGRRQNYKHPIAAFGSEAEEKCFRVVCLFGRMDAGRLIDTFKEIGNAKHTLVFLDYALTLPDRRELARRTKTELAGKIFAVVDRVVIAFLVRHYTEQSVNRMLMHLIMPFASYQPYVVDSANVMPQEIFIGRGAELEKIESPKGVNIVYGGRQLGKSALLRMAKKDIDQDENGDRAILVDVKDKDYKQAALAVSEELFLAGIFTEEEMVTDDWNMLARDLKRRLRDRRLPEIPYLLLMMDEADVFIESCAEVGYMPFDALKDVQGIGTDRFKFVVAGLRNIVRFNKSKALGGNSGLAHLGDLTVKPFKSIEARQLLIEPLSYLGFRFPHNRETEVLISTILSTTNYFPGMIQLYCSKLIETMQRGYAGFAEADTPPYVVGKEQIKKVLNDEKLLEAISDKFFVTLSDKDD
ncbi:MAG: hypothetical protein IIZ39_10700, partial [Blautia sp.]|nr:hypothetical protein [Blautia sp.]